MWSYDRHKQQNSQFINLSLVVSKICWSEVVWSSKQCHFVRHRIHDCILSFRYLSIDKIFIHLTSFRWHRTKPMNEQCDNSLIYRKITSEIETDVVFIQIHTIFHSPVALTTFCDKIISTSFSCFTFIHFNFSSKIHFVSSRVEGKKHLISGAVFVVVVVCRQ